jgi:hypothetical protein
MDFCGARVMGPLYKYAEAGEKVKKIRETMLPGAETITRKLYFMTRD